MKAKNTIALFMKKMYFVQYHRNWEKLLIQAVLPVVGKLTDRKKID